ncbi:TICN1 protein, partial [Polypterus senegalus]
MVPVLLRQSFITVLSDLLQMRVHYLLGFCTLFLLQVEGRRTEIITAASNNGNSVDNDKWLSTVSQYDKDRYWNKFRDVNLISFNCSMYVCIYCGEWLGVAPSWDAWKDQRRDYGSSGPREGSCPGWYGDHGNRAWKLNPIGARGHHQRAPRYLRSSGPRHFRYTQKCQQKIIGRHLEHIQVDIKWATSLHSRARVGWKRTKAGGEEWRRSEARH